VALTRKMSEAGRLLDIYVLDHLIVGDGKYVSLKEKGIL
jgi:DNA repair protein RadC